MPNKDIKFDILRELFNISVGKAASMLSEIINKKIILNVPNIDVFDKENGKFNIYDYFPETLDGTLMVSSICFQEKLSGKANLIFPAEKMRTFINLCSNEEQCEYEGQSFTDVDFDIIKEIGNIILNAIIGEIGNGLDFRLNYTLPEVKVFTKIDFSRDIENNGYDHIYILYITFLIDDTEIEGAVIVDLTLNSLNELRKRLKQIEDDLYE